MLKPNTNEQHDKPCNTVSDTKTPPAKLSEREAKTQAMICDMEICLDRAKGFATVVFELSHSPQNGFGDALGQLGLALMEEHERLHVMWLDLHEVATKSTGNLNGGAS